VRLLYRIFLPGVGLVVVSGVIYAGMGGFGGLLAGGDTRPTFFEQFVIAGGPIVWFVLLPLSVVTVFLAVEHFLTIRRKRLLPEGAARSIGMMIARYGLGQLEARLGGREDLVSRAVLRASRVGKGDWFRMKNVLAESFQDQASRLLRRVAWLNLIGNVSPMVGLFGTVYGMIKLFNTIVSTAGQPAMVQLADGISTALVTTFWGLFIAIPAIAIHGVFQNRIEALVNDAVTEAEGIMRVLRRAVREQKEGVGSGGARGGQVVREVVGGERKTSDKAAASR